MTAFHTPRPWTNSDGLVNGRDSRERFASSPSLDIFDAGEWPAELHGEAQANAHLIAAAPDLLGALRFILAFYEPGQRHLDTEAWKVAEASARQAVAKAEGRS